MDQKLENLLNLSLEATPVEREKSDSLEVGFNRQSRTWDLIVKHSGNLERIREEIPGIRIVELSGGFAVITVRQDLINVLSDYSEIEYIEKPKRLFFAVAQGKRASCIDRVQLELPGGQGIFLTGKEILVAVIDSGVDYTHPEFRNADGTTRIRAIWDQTIQEESSDTQGEESTVPLGREFSQEEINQALLSDQRLPTVDLSGHGTQVLGIAAGNSGVAPDSEILVVKLGTPEPEGFPRTTELMMAIEYVYKKARELGLPVAINLSFGNVYGPHDGTGLLEIYLDSMAQQWKSVIVAGTGNEGNTAGHTSRKLLDLGLPGMNTGTFGEGSANIVEIGIAEGETNLSIQLWKSYADTFQIYLSAPDGEEIGPLYEVLGPQRYVLSNTELLIYYGKPSPFSIAQEIYFDFIPRNNYVTSGIWKLRFVPEKITDGQVNLWMPEQKLLNFGTRFYRPVPENTLTIPSTARNVIAVGAYDSRSQTYASFSGRGGGLGVNQVKPDLAAPGVNIRTATVGGSYITVTGTSFAAPFVTGSAALLMQWGIVDGNDPYLYGEKVRAYLRRGAIPLPGQREVPDEMVGYGTLCVRDSLPL